MTITTLHAVLATVLATVLAAVLIGAATAAPLPTFAFSPLSQAATSAAADDVEHATEWPTGGDEAAIKRSVAKLRKARNDEMEIGGRGEVVAIGAAAAPFLLRVLGKEKGEDARERLTNALDLVTTAEHTRLLAKHFEDKPDALRHYALRRVAILGDPGLRETAETLLDTLEARAADPKARKKVSEVDLDLAALLCVATGSPRGLARVLPLAAPKLWVRWRTTLRPVAASARVAGVEVGQAIAGSLRGAEGMSERVAALNLLAYAGGKELTRAVRPSLDAEENNVKIAAINALRMMVDGDPPLDRLSTFDAIERANKWKTRL